MNKGLWSAPWPHPREFTFEEACAGMEGVDFFDGLPRNTSCGYPLSTCVPKGHTGKTHLFGKSGPYTFDSDECVALKKEVDDILSDALVGKRRLHLFTDFLKDERREREKARAGKSRMISGAPLALTIAQRMLFGDFIRHVMSNRVKNGCAIGINPTKEWNDLAKHLSGMSANGDPNILAGDYAGYDGSQTRQLLLSSLDLIKSWYGPDNRWNRARDVLFEDISNSRHLVENVIYDFDGSLPSGCILTAMLGSIINLKAIRMSVIFLSLGKRDFERTDWESVDWISLNAKADRYATSVVFGDDNVIAVSDEAIPWLNQNTITEAMAFFGFQYTPENKVVGLCSYNHRTIEEIDFLKRSFAKNTLDGTYTCPLQLDVILEMPQWTKKTDRLAITCDNVKASLEELSLHTREVFEKFAPVIAHESRIRLGYSPPNLSYRSLQARRVAAVDYPMGF